MGAKITFKSEDSALFGYDSASGGIGSNMVQPKYGVVINPNKIQAKYGVMIDPTGVVQPKYGANPPIQAKYGVVVPPQSGQDLDITYKQLEENIATLKKSIASLKNAWETETKKNLTKLDNSWVGDDCASYTSKLTNMDKKVTNTIAALELLCSTYEQARDMVKESQLKAISKIDSIG